MEFVDCTSSDELEIISLWERCKLTRPWNNPHDDFHKALLSLNSTVLAGREGAVLLATVMVGYDGHRGWVYYLAVEPTRRKMGLGRSAMRAAEQWLRARGATKLQLMVREDNEASLSFYERLGLERQAVVTLGKSLNGH